MIITVKILKKGRKYWAAATDPKGWACKVVINDVSKNFELGQIVSLDAEDVGTKTRWGSTYIYDPSAIATPEEIAAVEAAEEAARKAAAERKARSERLYEIKSAIRKAEHYAKDVQPSDLEGEVILDTFNIYGGGARFVAADKWLWYIDNNGGDGDDWSVTNVYGGPGTPGGIGWRIPRDEALVKELRGLCHTRA